VTALVLAALAAVVGALASWQADRRSMLFSPLALSSGGSIVLFAVIGAVPVALASAGAAGECVLGAGIASFSGVACVAWFARSKRP
jgi:hypothetical protein